MVELLQFIVAIEKTLTTSPIVLWGPSRVDVFHSIACSLHRIRFLVWNFNHKFIFNRHNDLNSIQRIQAQVFREMCIQSQLNGSMDEQVESGETFVASIFSNPLRSSSALSSNAVFSGRPLLKRTNDSCGVFNETGRNREDVSGVSRAAKTLALRETILPNFNIFQPWRGDAAHFVTSTFHRSCNHPTFSNTTGFKVSLNSQYYRK